MRRLLLLLRLPSSSQHTHVHAQHVCVCMCVRGSYASCVLFLALRFKQIGGDSLATAQMNYMIIVINVIVVVCKYSYPFSAHWLALAWLCAGTGMLMRFLPFHPSSADAVCIRILLLFDATHIHAYNTSMSNRTLCIIW